MRRNTSIAAYIRDLGASKSAQRWYRHRAAVMRELEHQARTEGKPLAARANKFRADMLDHAARNEFFDVDP